MLLYTMTNEEAYKEMSLDRDWLMGRMKGLSLKYNKKMREYAKKKQADVFLGLSKYKTPRGNEAFILCYTGVSIYNIRMAFFFRVSSGSKTKVMLSDFKHREIAVFTDHFISRWQERNPKDDNHLFKFLNEISLSGVIAYGENTNEGTMAINDGLCFLSIEGNAKVFKTFVSNDLLGENQKELVQYLNERTQVCRLLG